MARLKKGESRSNEQIQKDVLAAYEACGNITAACKKAKVPRRTFYNWLDEANPANKDFIAAFESSNKLAVGILEEEAHRRAVKGVKRDVYYQGKKCGVETEYSDTLLIVLLKAHAPEKYKERTSNEHSGPNGGPIPTEVVHRIIFDDNGG